MLYTFQRALAGGMTSRNMVDMMEINGKIIQLKSNTYFAIVVCMRYENRLKKRLR